MKKCQLFQNTKFSEEYVLGKRIQSLFEWEKL